MTAERAAYLSGAFDAEIRPGIDNTYDVELTASEPTGLRITTSSLPAATISVAYEAELEEVGGSPPYIWSWSSHSPPGLILDASGQVTGAGGRGSSWRECYHLASRSRASPSSARA